MAEPQTRLLNPQTLCFQSLFNTPSLICARHVLLGMGAYYWKAVDQSGATPWKFLSEAINYQ